MTESRNQRGPAPRQREVESRDNQKRSTPWTPASLTPQPNPREGLEFRYVRASMRGEADNINVSQALREGWEPVLASGADGCSRSQLLQRAGFAYANAPAGAKLADHVWR